MTSRTVPEHMYVFVLFWHEMKNSVVAEIGLFQSQPLMNILFHFLIIVELVMHCFFGIDRWLSQGVILQHNSGTLHTAYQTEEWQSFIQNFFYNPPCCLGCRSNACVTNSTVVRKWDWLYVVGCESQNLISAMQIFKFLLGWEKCIDTLWNDVEKLYSSWRNELCLLKFLLF